MTHGVWEERCQACGNCILEKTGGICPVARCAKQLLNGPCGGSSKGKCEIKRETDCAWQLIYDRLKALGQLHKLEEIIPAKRWGVESRDSGPRRIVREDLKSMKAGSQFGKNSASRDNLPSQANSALPREMTSSVIKRKADLLKGVCGCGQCHR